MSEVATLIAAGYEHRGWTSVSVTRSIEAFSGSFQIALTERWPGESQIRPIPPGAGCTLLLGEDPVITGYVDDAEPSIDATSHAVTIRGRDAAADLVDCSVRSNPGEWHNVDLMKITKDIVREFGIDSWAAVDVGKPFPSFRIQESETAYEAIERACRARAVMATSDGLGNLVITSALAATRSNHGVAEGGNVKAATGRFSVRERFSSYTVKGHMAEFDQLSAAEIAGPKGEAFDPAVTRFRPMTLIAEDAGDNATFKDRALWESVIRAGRAVRAEVTVAGWRDGGGDLWRPNTLIPCSLPSLGLDRTMLVSSVRFSQGEGGTETLLVLSHPDAFKLIELSDTEEEGLGW